MSQTHCWFFTGCAVLDGEQLRAWCAAGPAPPAFSPWGEHAALVVDLASTSGLTDAPLVAAWMKTLVCPVVGVRDLERSRCTQPEHALISAACDVVVDELAAAEHLLERVRRNPVAATSFVDLLRVTEPMPLDAALNVESAVYATLQGGAEYRAWLDALATQPEVATESGPPIIAEREDDELTLMLNRPANRNAMSVEIRDALIEVLRLVEADDSIRRVHLGARGDFFSTGGDLREFGSVPDSARGHLVRLLAVPGRFLARVADRVHIHVHGGCIGSGIEFPAFAGHLSADPQAWFQLPEVGMGLIPGAGGCISIARRIGRQRLGWWGLSGKRIRAELALEWGLIDEICDSP